MAKTGGREFALLCKVQNRVSIAELIDGDIPIRSDEAVAILRDVCRQYSAGDLRGIPNATVIRLTPDGRIVVEGPVSRDQDAVHAAATLLADLLPGFDTPTGFKVPGGLRLLMARATRAIDLPPFADIAEFAAALDRFGAPDLGEAVRGLFRSWASRQAAHTPERSNEITISDIRRARRATGLSLEDVAHGSGLAAAALRELEWGYLRNWRGGDEGRDDLRRYARAAGLDEALVLSVAWPLVEARAEDEPLVEQRATSTAKGWALLPVARPLMPVLTWRPRRAASRSMAVDRYRWALALGAATMIVFTAVAMEGNRPVPDAAIVESKAPELEPRLVSPPVAPLVEDVRPIAAELRPATYEQPASPRPRPVKAKARGVKDHRSQPQERKPLAPEPHKSFFKRELLRIVITK